MPARDAINTDKNATLYDFSKIAIAITTWRHYVWGVSKTLATTETANMTTANLTALTIDLAPIGDFATPAQVEAIMAAATLALVTEEDDQIVGTCPVCFRAHVVASATDAPTPRAAIMVRHGWTEEGRRLGEYGMGHQYGACSGVNAPAFELSREITIKHLAALEAYLVRCNEQLAKLVASPPATIMVASRRRGEPAHEVAPGSYAYDSELGGMKYRAEKEIRGLKVEITETAQAIAEWAPRALRTSSGIARAERAEIEARAAERKAKSSAKANATAERKAAAAAKLAAKLAPVLAAMAAAPERFFTENEIQTLAKTAKLGKLTDAQLWGMVYGGPLKQDGYADAYQLRAK